MHLRGHVCLRCPVVWARGALPDTLGGRSVRLFIFCCPPLLFLTTTSLLTLSPQVLLLRNQDQCTTGSLSKLIFPGGETA